MMMKKFRWVVYVCLLCCTSFFAQADFVFSDAGPDHLWQTDLNWVGGAAPEPNAMQTVIFSEPNSICELYPEAGNVMAQMILLGDKANATLIVNGGTLAASAPFVLGHGGQNAFGTLVLNDGIVNAFGGYCALGIGWHANSKGVLEVHGGQLNVRGSALGMAVDGANQENYLLMDGGNIYAATPFSIGIRGDATNTVDISGGLLEVGEYMAIGEAAGIGICNLSGTGEITIGTDLVVSFHSGTEGTLNVSGGSITVGGGMRIGAEDDTCGRVNISGGVINVGTHAVIGQTAGADGCLNVSGGTMNVAGTLRLYKSESVRIAGGFVTCGSLVVSSPVGVSAIDISSGELRCIGDDRDSLLGYIRDGRLTGDGKNGALRVVYDAAADITSVTYNSVMAWGPHPGNWASLLSNVKESTALSWSAGEGALSHILYFGTDKTLVANGDSSVNMGAFALNGEAYDPGSLSAEQAYYWRVDEVQADSSVVTGELWAFYIKSAYLIDDFETYNDINPLAGVWVGVNAEVSVGTAFEGQQAMLVKSTGASAAATKALQAGSLAAYDALTVHFRGSLGNEPGLMSITLTDQSNAVSTVVYAGPAEDVCNYSDQWGKWIVDMDDFTGIDKNNVAALTISLNNTTSSEVLFDNIMLYSGLGCNPADAPKEDLNGDCAVDLKDLAVIASQWLSSTQTLVSN